MLFHFFCAFPGDPTDPCGVPVLGLPPEFSLLNNVTKDSTQQPPWHPYLPFLSAGPHALYPSQPPVKTSVNGAEAQGNSKGSGGHTPVGGCARHSACRVGRPRTKAQIIIAPLHARWKVKAAQSCPTLCDPMADTVHGIL